jgi:ankyrin repeat protein
MDHEAVVRVLIEAGVDINKSEDEGIMPLLFAANEGNEAVVRVLIEAGADVNKVERRCTAASRRCTQTSTRRWITARRRCPYQ